MSDTEKKYDVDLSIKLRTGVFGPSDPEVVKVKQKQVTLDQIHEMVLFHISALEEPVKTEAGEIGEDEEKPERDFDCCASENDGIRPGKVTEINIEQHIAGPTYKTTVTENYEYDEEGLLMKKITTTEGTVGYGNA